ncbi:MAG: DUF6489 family protein [Acetobacterales bacterium]
MKISIDIECTPEEARTFLGLPDVRGMQEALATAAQERMRDGLKDMDSESLLRLWFPAGLEGLGELQKQFWTAMAKASGGGSGGER